MKTDIKDIIKDILHVTLRPRRYATPQGRTDDWWRGVMRRYANTEKRIESSSSKWYVILYDDGRLETARLRVLHGGLISGISPAIYRGMLIPRRIGYGTFSHVKDLWLAF